MPPETASRLPQSRRLRLAAITRLDYDVLRLTIAAVAATAARLELLAVVEEKPASRLPQSRRLRREIREAI